MDEQYQPYLHLLLHLAKNTKLYGRRETSTMKLAEETKSSQQTISRKLQEMDDLGLIERKVTLTGITLLLTAAGIHVLEDLHEECEALFEHQSSIEGEIISGLGEGKYYVRLYRDRIQKSLHFRPFYGTLNIKVDDATLRKILLAKGKVTIEGFKTRNRTFGKVFCWKTAIGGSITGAIILPDRSTHKNVIEVIAPVNIRKKLKLENGGKVQCRLK
ncbi:CTP-dependent riboflavin kinase [Candidatus Woesearchaeota archaeon]|nr:CTP-dependent riboflavin kinase [Candidatus Woesearchaeota archaeon]